MHDSYNVLLTSDAIADPVRTVVPQISIGSEGGPFIPSAGLGYDVSYGLSRRVRAGGGIIYLITLCSTQVYSRAIFVLTVLCTIPEERQLKPLTDIMIRQVMSQVYMLNPATISFLDLSG